MTERAFGASAKEPNDVPQYLSAVGLGVHAMDYRTFTRDQKPDFRGWRCFNPSR